MEKKPFYLFKRKLPSGKSVYYWYHYRADGTRSTPESTGKTKKNEAFNFCVKRLENQGRFCISGLTFGEFADGWFTENHYYLRNKRDIGKIKKSTVHSRQVALNKYILPYFSNYVLTGITSDDVFKFRKMLINNNLSGNYIKSIMQALSIMLKDATERELIPKNPIPSNMGEVKTETSREAFTIDELKYIFSQEWKYEKIKVYCLLATITGMRFSEIRGLNKEQIKDNCIDIDRQYYGDYGVQDTKTDEKRFVPIPSRLRDMLLNLPENEIFVFSSLKNIGEPLYERTVRDALYDKYSEDMLKTKKTRTLTFHSFRYFLNTYLLNKGIQEGKVDFILGHSSGKGSMRRLYTTWKPEMYEDVLKLQEELIDDLLAPCVQE